MEENNFWLAIWRTVAYFVVCMAIVVASCDRFGDSQRSEFVLKAMAAGATAQEAVCASYNIASDASGVKSVDCLVINLTKQR